MNSFDHLGLPSLLLKSMTRVLKYKSEHCTCTRFNQKQKQNLDVGRFFYPTTVWYGFALVVVSRFLTEEDSDFSLYSLSSFWYRSQSLAATSL